MVYNQWDNYPSGLGALLSEGLPPIQGGIRRRIPAICVGDGGRSATTDVGEFVAKSAFYSASR
jgi:hypothetical protein